jgi:outer membrane protein insertion porin family
MQISRLLILALCLSGAAAAQTPTPAPLLDVKGAGAEKPEETLKLVKIDFAGLNKRTPESAQAVCGLQTGQNVTMNDIEQAAQRLSDSGWFRKIAYRLKGPSADSLTLTFTVEEDESPNLVVVFDNFVWFSDQELVDKIRVGGILGFDGTIPDGGKAPEIITQILERELAVKRLKGRVEHETLASLSSEPSRIVFTVRDVRLPVCALSFPGAANVPEKILQNAASELLGQNYSRYTASFVAREKLRPLYRQRGFWRVQFADATAELASDAECNGGARVSVSVKENAQYAWDATAWAGNTAYQTPELDAALGLKSGEVADQTKFNRGLRGLQELYSRKGYLDLLIGASPVFRDADKRLGWRFVLTEGPQYRMGRLTISNLPPSDTQALLKEWALKTGDAYDSGYLETFIKNTMLPRLAQLGKVLEGMKIASKTTPDKQKFTVDITIELVKDEKK